MRLSFLLLFSYLLPSMALGDVCPHTWKTQDQKKVVTVLCRLEWEGKDALKGVEIALVKQGCQFTDGLEDCAFIRSCVSEGVGETGATVFRSGSPAEAFCLSGSEEEVFSGGDSSPRAYITCIRKHDPKEIRLESPDRKISKVCPFPFKGKL